MYRYIWPTRSKDKIALVVLPGDCRNNRKLNCFQMGKMAVTKLKKSFTMLIK